MDSVKYESATFDTVENNVSIETFNLNGQYTIIENYINNEYTGPEIVNIDCQIGTIYHAKKAFYRGNILCKRDDPNAKAMIELMVKASCATKPLPDYLDTSKATKEQMKWGTICPTKEEVFQYKNYKFNLYGRYIYGYDQWYIHLRNKSYPNQSLEVSDESSDECSVDSRGYNTDSESIHSLHESENVIPPNSLNEKEIIIAPINDPDDKYLRDYNYCFTILDENNVLVAFAIYN